MSDTSEKQEAVRPRPFPDDASADYWRAANEGRLAIQRCRQCRHWNHAPSMNCPACGSVDLAFEDVSGEAKLFSWTEIHHSPGPAFADKLPLLVGIVELVEQPHLLLVANLPGSRAEDLRLGMPLQVEFERISEDCALPQFRAVGGQS
ncbi:MAG: OB-fold domain-containing protein [Novosphingobium sp.]|nr:OB-fold domain-containing protein [Novosphingobium sp.]